MVSCLPLTERVEFKTLLQKGNRFQVPKLIRWKYKLENTQVLKVSVAAAGTLGGWETFFGRMDKSGRITISKLIQEQLLRTASGKGDTIGRSLAGEVIRVQLEPV